VLRSDWIGVPWSAAVWPILGSMFMFRLCVYLYDLKHDTGRPNVARTLSYFFLLPNVCFPLFPVVDFKTFRRTYYDAPAFDIYQKGVGWIFRGVVHLVLYRVVYYHLTLTPAEVRDVPDLVQFLTSNFLLYLRVSGQFHVIVGILHLFGFNLPPTHYFFYLASSFNDFWRRINIYWKDFMMKLFYYPTYFKLRRMGTTAALVLSTLLVFMATWLLHSYQWFWLRGDFPIVWQDGAFWGVLAILVIANSLYEAKHGRMRSLERRAWSFGGSAGVALRTAATFCVICVLWSVWTSASFSEWLALWSLPDGWGTADMSSMVSVLLLGTVWFGLRKDPASGDPHRAQRPLTFSQFRSSGLATALSIAALYALGQPALYTRLGAAGELVESARSARLNVQDAAELEIGYYEGLMRVDRFNAQLWEVYARGVDEFGRFYQIRNDFLLKELRPSVQRQFRQRPYSTNVHGMRDQDYRVAKDPDVHRIAMLGSSVLMGWGIGDGETFEALVEHRLNVEHSPASPNRYEVLNFGVGGYGPLDELADFEQRVLKFEPDVIVYIGHHTDERRAVRHLLNVLSRGVEIPYPELRQVLIGQDVNAKTAETIATRRLQPYAEQLVTFAYRRMASLCRDRGIVPVWVSLPLLEGESPHRLPALARDAGFHVIDLADLYDGQDRRALQNSETDSHPNTVGHQLIARRLYDGLIELDRGGAAGLLTRPSPSQ
jgi:D-alanyl-lipoteichoic acid acyltransferase DltB (MBOAT superfamily)